MTTFGRTDLDVVSIEGLHVDCIVGVYPRERVEPQPLVVDVSLLLDTRVAAAQAAFDHTVDYARLADEVRFILLHGRFGMLETAGDALARWALAAGRFVDAARVGLRKPDAFGGAGAPSLVVVRRAEEVVLAPRATSWGAIETIASSRVCRVERATILPGRAFEPTVVDDEEAAELTLSGPGDATQARLVVVRRRPG